MKVYFSLNDLIFSSEVLNSLFQPGMSEDSDVEQGQLLRLTCQDSNENIRASSQELCHHHFYTLNRFSTALAQYSTGIAIGKESENVYQLAEWVAPLPLSVIDL